jgi:hypothetical protein
MGKRYGASSAKYQFPDVRKLLSCQLIRSNSFLTKGFCALAKSPDTRTRLFADFLFRRTDAKFPAQVANVAAAHHPAARIQILLLDTFEKFKPEFHLPAGSVRSGIPGNGLRATPLPQARGSFEAVAWAAAVVVWNVVPLEQLSCNAAGNASPRYIASLASPA